MEHMKLNFIIARDQCRAGKTKHFFQARTLRQK